MSMEEPVVLFDGVCNLCNGAVGFIIRHDKAGVLRFASLQSGFGQSVLQRFSLPPHEFDTMVFLHNNRVYLKSDAVLEIAGYLPGFAWLRVFRFLPRFIRDAFYRLISANRYRLFGRQEACMLPEPGLMRRFL